MTKLEARPYHPDDLSACLAIFDSNVPHFFAASERAEFRDFLESHNTSDGCYLVLARATDVIACGGLTTSPVQGRAVLAWGMVDRVLQGQGLGTALMTTRLAHARATQAIVELTLATSQHSMGFYAAFGFAVSHVTPNGFAPGLDRCDMTLRLDAAIGCNGPRQGISCPPQPEG